MPRRATPVILIGQYASVLRQLGGGLGELFVNDCEEVSFFPVAGLWHGVVLLR